MVTTLNFQSGRQGSSSNRDDYSMRLDRGMHWAYPSFHPSGVVHRYQSGWTSKLWLGVHWLNIRYHPEYVFAMQFSVDNHLLQVLGWALTEYGDSLQSLVNTPSLNNKVIHCTFFREWHCHRGKIHYITLHLFRIRIYYTQILQYLLIPIYCSPIP